MPLPASGRTFSIRRAIGLGDVGPDGRLRLDALARLLQDVAGADADDAGLDETWLVRRAVVASERWPELPDRVELTTWCGGVGARWAERRTRLVATSGAVVEVAALWVHVDARGRPAPVGDRFDTAYAGAAGGRRVSARLHHRPPPRTADQRPWALRYSDLDLLGHVNNAATWEAVVDELGAVAPGRIVARAEIEYPAALNAGDDVVLRRVFDDEILRVWLTVDRSVRASAVVALRDDGGPGTTRALRVGP